MTNHDTTAIRKFGIIGAVLFAILTTVSCLNQHIWQLVLFSLLLLLCVGFIIIPNKLKPIYAGWLTIAHFLGKVNTAILLTLFYYLAITPFRLVRKIFGVKSVFVKIDRNSDTYWVKRKSPGQNKESYYKRF